MNVSSLSLTDTAEGCRILLRVRAGARSPGIVGAHGQALKLAVSAAPERGRANRAVLALLAEALGVPATRLRLLSGEASLDKAALIEGLSGEDVRRRLAVLHPPARPAPRSASGRLS